MNIQPNPKKKLEIETSQGVYLRLPIKTRLVTEKDDLIVLLREYVQPLLMEGDMIFISEKICALVQGCIIKIADVKPSRLATLLAGKVRNKVGTPEFVGYGHGTPVAMQLMIDTVGSPRILFAAVVSALTRPFGIKGMFYRVCGKVATSIDCPMSFVLEPYTGYAKLPLTNAPEISLKVKEALGRETVVIDANYRGVVSLGKSDKNIAEKFVKELFRDNPLGQDGEMTPFCIVRKQG